VTHLDPTSANWRETAERWTAGLDVVSEMPQ
jgi:hypothetical protein